MARKYLLTDGDTSSTYDPSGTEAVNGQAITVAIEALDVTDTAEDGKYVSSVSEADGKITVTRESLPDHSSGDIAAPESATANQVLTYDGTNWVAKDAQGGGGGSSYTAGTDIAISTDNVISYDDSAHRDSGTTVGTNSHAEGEKVISNNINTHAEGYNTSASGSHSHAEGYQSVASGDESHAEGYGARATGSISHAEGELTIASGSESHAEGYGSQATADYSHAEGLSTIAASQNQHVQGKYNIRDSSSKYAHIVGGGNYNTRKNIHTLDWSGNAEFAGNVTDGNGNVLSNKVDSVTGKGLSTNDYTTEDQTKLAGIASGAEVNVQSDWNVTDTTSDAFILNKPTIPSYSVATTSADGLMSSSDKNKLDGIVDPMSFKGSLGTEGTIVTLPAAETSNKGFTYKVITAGTYASQSAKVGDTFISDGSTWILIPSGDEPSGTVTSVAVKMNGSVVDTITTSGTIDLGTVITDISEKQDKLTTQTAYSAKGSATKIPQITTNTLGQVTGITEIDIEGGGGNISIASADTLGGVKVGDNLSITEDGVLSANELDIKFRNNEGQAQYSVDGVTWKNFRYPVGTAESNDVLTGKTFANSDSDSIEGSMADNGAVSKVLTTSDTSYSIPVGYHNGSGEVKINTQSKTVTPTTSQQTVTPDDNYVLSSVVVGASTSDTPLLNITSIGSLVSYTIGSENVTTVKFVKSEPSTYTNLYILGTNVPAYHDNDSKTLYVVYQSNMLLNGKNTDFSNCSSLTSIENLSACDFSKANLMDTFFGCSSLTSIDCSSIKVTNKCEYLYETFFGCSSLTALDVSGFDTSNVTDMMGMFNGCSSLTSLDLSNFDTSNVTNMGKMFNSCSSLTSLDLNNFNTSKVTDMSNMFFWCSELTTLDLSNFDTSKVTDMTYMFGSCISLTSLNISNFDTSKVAYMNRMFSNCGYLTSLYIGADTDTAPQPLIISNAFADCPSTLKIYVPSHLVSAYKAATNWSTYASQIVART